jgi:hypothetical protein
MTLHQGLGLAMGLGILCAAPPAAGGGPFDGSKALLCSVTDTDQCEDDGACLDGDADDIRVPRFVRIDFSGKQVRVLDEGREEEKTAIQSVTRQNGRTILQGVEEGRGWSLLISEETGDTTLTVSDDGFALSAFGSCTAL